MTIASTTSKVSYNGSGSTGPFPITYKFTKNADITATKRSSAGVENVLALTTDYTLTGAGDAAGGSLTLTVALAVGESLVIARAPGIVQEVDYVENSAFPAETHESALDLLTTICQSLQEQVDRAVKVEISSTTNPDDLLAELAVDVASAAASAATATTQAGLANTARIAAELAETNAEAAAASIPTFAAFGETLAATTTASNARAALELGTAALVDTGTGPGDVPILDAGGKIDAGVLPVAMSIDTTARDIAIFDTLLNQIGLGRAAGAIPSGYMHLFLSDELATKTNAAYDAAGDYYYNPASYVDETANISSIAQINFNQGGTCTLTALRDGTLTGGCGTQDETGSSLDLIFSSAKGIGKIEFYNYANTERLKAFTVRRYNAGAWTKVPITAITGGTIINTDEGQVNNANGWVVCEFASVSDTQFRLAFTSVWGIGDANAYLPEAKIYSLAGAANMTLVPTAITAGSAPTTVNFYMLHKAVDSTTLNTDLKARVSRDNGSNWSAFVTLAEVCQYDADYKLLKGTADLSALASGTSVKWEITTLNTKSQRVRAAAMILNS